MWLTFSATTPRLDTGLVTGSESTARLRFSTLSATMDLKPGTIVANRYRISHRLGSGEAGNVWAAENIRTKRSVAIKLLKPDLRSMSTAVERARREARALGTIASEHVMQIFDVEEDSEYGVVLVFELLEGETLIDRLRRTGPMPFEDLHPIIEQVWAGLAAAHRVGIVHRNLKPSHVFLEKRPDGSTRVKVLDFGSAKMPKETGGKTITEMGQSLGTFAFMPPEQISKAKTVDHRGDIYACATVIFQALSGQLPYSTRDVLVMVEVKKKLDARTLSEVSSGPVDPLLEAFLVRGLARDPGARFQSALEALDAWRQVLAHRHDAPPAPHKDPFGLVGDTIEGKYRIDAVVGEGGFGVVYKGAHLPFDGIPIAVKCLKIPAEYTREGRAAFVDNFRREGAVLCKFGSEPGIVRVHAYGVTPTPGGSEVPFLVLEWLEGQTLDRILADRIRKGMGAFSEREALDAVCVIADTIAAAHAEGIAHRDLKPANIMQIRTRKGHAWKVLDFGIAKAMQEGETATQIQSRTSSGCSAFSPAYGAPEQFLRASYGPTGPWTDVHALGLILVELLTGRPALDGADIGPLYVSATAQTRPTPRVRGARVSDACEALCKKALALMPKERFRDADAMAREVEAILHRMQLPSSELPASEHVALAQTEPAVPGLQPAVAVRVNFDIELPEAPISPYSTTVLDSEAVQRDPTQEDGGAPAQAAPTDVLPSLGGVGGLAPETEADGQGEKVLLPRPIPSNAHNARWSTALLVVGAIASAIIAGYYLLR